MVLKVGGVALLCVREDGTKWQNPFTFRSSWAGQTDLQRSITNILDGWPWRSWLAERVPIKPTIEGTWRISVVRYLIVSK